LSRGFFSFHSQGVCAGAPRRQGHASERACGSGPSVTQRSVPLGEARAGTVAFSINIIIPHDDSPGRLAPTLIDDVPDSLRSDAVSSAGNVGLFASVDGTVRVWDSRLERPIRELAGAGSSPSSVAISPDQETALVGHQNGMVRMWSLRTLNRVGIS